MIEVKYYVRRLSDGEIIDDFLSIRRKEDIWVPEGYFLDTRPPPFYMRPYEDADHDREF